MMERMEARQFFAAAANVSAEIVGNTLVIQGTDQKNHSLIIQGLNTVSTVVSPGRGTTINGSALPITFTGSPPLAIDLGGGNDSVVLLDLNFQSTTLNTGGGNDVVIGTVTPAASQNLFGTLQVNTGTGNDVIHLGKTGVANDLAIDAGAGNDIVELVQGTGVGNNLTVHAGNGADLIHLSGTVFVGGNLNADGGAGPDILLKRNAAFTVGGTNLSSAIELIV